MNNFSLMPSALILAAGRGERMRPLSDQTPKPLLKVHGVPLIEWHLRALSRDGIKNVVINTAHLEDQFPIALGDGSRWGLRIEYAMEGRDHGGALETAGAMVNALPSLGEIFWVLAGDVYAPDFRFEQQAALRFLNSLDWGHLWLVPNPPHHPRGDFLITAKQRLHRLTGSEPNVGMTYSTIGLYRPEMVQHLTLGHKAALRPCLERAMDADRLSGQVYQGRWTDVGTPERLAQLNADLSINKVTP